MITQIGESTANRGAEGSQNVDSDDTAGNSVTDTEDSIFYTLRSSELLKHLLRADNADVQHCTRERRDDSRNGWPAVSQDASKKQPGVIQCDEGINNITQQSEAFSYQRFKQLELPPPAGCDKNGSMERVSLEQTSPSQASVHLFNKEVQNSLQRFLSSERGSSTVHHNTFIEDDLSVFADDVFSNETMDYILAEAQRSLCIESPSSQEGDSCEFTELQPLSVPTCEITKDASCSSNECLKDDSSHPTETAPNPDVSRGELVTENCDSDSDSDVNEAMVLVPAGKYLHTKYLVTTTFPFLLSE